MSETRAEYTTDRGVLLDALNRVPVRWLALLLKLQDDILEDDGYGEIEIVYRDRRITSIKKRQSFTAE